MEKSIQKNYGDVSSSCYSHEMQARAQRFASFVALSEPQRCQTVKEKNTRRISKKRAPPRDFFSLTTKQRSENLNDATVYNISRGFLQNKRLLTFKNHY